MVKTTVTAYLDVEQLQQLDELADELEDTSRTALIREAVETFLVGEPERITTLEHQLDEALERVDELEDQLPDEDPVEEVQTVEVQTTGAW